MIIDEKTLFNNEVFCLSENFTCEKITTEVSEIFLIDNFYEDLSSVLLEIEKLPIIKVNKVSDNNLKYFDGRKCYFQSMSGTEIPYVDPLKYKISNIIKYPHNRIDIERNILINCFKFKDEKLLSDNYYSPHSDPFLSQNISGQYALVVFLNNYYDQNEGLNFYKIPRKKYNQSEYFCKKDEIGLLHFVQAKPNRAVLFDCRLIHGQALGDKQFMNEMRYTQVIFCPLW